MNINVEVTSQGAPVFNDAYVRRKSRHIIAIEIDMASKYTQVEMSGGHDVMVFASERSMHLDESQDRESATTLSVSGMPDDFSLFATGGGCYTINLAYVRDQTRFEIWLEAKKWACLRIWDRFWGKE